MVALNQTSVPYVLYVSVVLLILSIANALMLEVVLTCLSLVLSVRFELPVDH